MKLSRDGLARGQTAFYLVVADETFQPVGAALLVAAYLVVVDSEDNLTVCQFAHVYPACVHLAVYAYSL